MEKTMLSSTDEIDRIVDNLYSNFTRFLICIISSAGLNTQYSIIICSVILSTLKRFRKKSRKISTTAYVVIDVTVLRNKTDETNPSSFDGYSNLPNVIDDASCNDEIIRSI